MHRCDASPRSGARNLHRVIGFRLEPGASESDDGTPDPRPQETRSFRPSAAPFGRAAGPDRASRALALLWERVWPPLAAFLTVLGLFFALSWLGLWLWLPPIGRAIGVVVFAVAALATLWRSFACVCRIGRGLRRLDRERPSASAGDHADRPARGQPKRSDDAGAVARACRARVARRPQAARRLADAAARRPRSDRASRAGARSSGCDLLRCRRRPQPPRRRRLQLAGRGRRPRITGSTPGSRRRNTRSVRR